MYARRVRILSGDCLLPEVHPSPFACTYLSSFRRPLVPGLREICLSDLYEHEWTTLLLLCSTTIKIVSLSDEEGDEDGRLIGGFLHSLGCNESHGLERLHILTARHNHLDCMTKFHMLQDIELSFSGETTGALLIEGFSKLSALNRLSRLLVKWEIEYEHHPLVSPLPPPHSVNFCSLRSIDITAPSYTALLLVQCLRVDTLRRIRIRCLPSRLHQPTTFRQVVRECGSVAPSLEEVDLDFYVRQPIGQETFDGVLDLTRRFRLQKLKFAWNGFEIDNAYIHTACLSCCFSHLEVLDLVSLGASYSPTLQVLRSLAIHCPVLKGLHMKFTVEKEHLPLLVKEMENEDPLSHGLKCLTIRLRNQPETAEIFANKSILIISQYLDSLFPSLDLLHTFGRFQNFTFVEGIRQTLKVLQHRPAMDSRRLVGSQAPNL